MSAVIPGNSEPQDNVVRTLTAAGKTWKCYVEALPSVGYLGSDDGAYLQHHNPFVYFSDVQNSFSQATNIVAFRSWALIYRITVCLTTHSSSPT